MTKAKSNVYAQAIVKMRDGREKALSASNTKKANSLVLLANDERVFKALTDNNVDAARFNARALYATEKCVKIVHNATRDALSASEVNDNALVAIKCALLCADANEKLLKSDIEQAILSDAKVDPKRAKLIYARKVKISAAAQVQQVIDMLKTLNVVKEVSRNAFEVQDTALTAMFREKFADLAV